MEHKEKFSLSLVKSVAAMANTYGGLIVVGVTDQKQDDRIVECGPGSAVSSSTANKATIREAGPASNDGYVVPVVMAAAASVRTCLADPQGRMRIAPWMEPPGLPERSCCVVRGRGRRDR